MASNNENGIGHLRALVPWLMMMMMTPRQGRPSPLRQWCISPLFQISPLFSKKCFDSVENFPNSTFSRKLFRFSSAKLSDDLFLVINHKFRISPLFLLFQYISPYFAKIILSPYFSKFPPFFRYIYVGFTYFVLFSFPPYFDHDAFMHHTMHVLDAPVPWLIYHTNTILTCKLYFRHFHFPARTVTKKDLPLQYNTTEHLYRTLTKQFLHESVLWLHS